MVITRIGRGGWGAWVMEAAMMRPREGACDACMQRQANPRPPSSATARSPLSVTIADVIITCTLIRNTSTIDFLSVPLVLTIHCCGCPLMAAETVEDLTPLALKSNENPLQSSDELHLACTLVQGASFITLAFICFGNRPKRPPPWF